MSFEKHRDSLAQLIARTMTDDSYRAEVKADPKAALIAAGMPIPAKMVVNVVEQTPGTHYFVIPARPMKFDGTPKGKLLNRLTTDPEYKARFIADPRAVLAERGIEMPAGVDLQLIVATPAEMTIALPAKLEGPEELTEMELAIAAGGTSSTSKKHHAAHVPVPHISPPPGDEDEAADAPDPGGY